MPVQIAYQRDLPAGFPGLIFDTKDYKLLTAAIQAEASAEMAFGTFVARATTTDELHKPKAKLLAAANDPIFGAVLHSHSYNRETDLGTIGLKPKTQLTVMEAGCVWMLAEEAMGMNDAVYARFATGAGGSTRGALRNDADTASCVLVKGARVIVPTISVTLLEQTYRIVGIELSVLVNKATA